MGSIQAATQQATERAIFGSGLSTYAWLGEMRPLFEYTEEGAPDGWTWEVQYGDPREEDRSVASVSHTEVMRAVREIASGRVKYAGKSLQKECQNLLFKADDADPDVDQADCILQVAVLGVIDY